MTLPAWSGETSPKPESFPRSLNHPVPALGPRKGFSLQQLATLPSLSLTLSSSAVVMIPFFIINLLFIKHNYRGVIEIIAAM